MLWELVVKVSELCGSRGLGSGSWSLRFVTGPRFT